MANRTAYVDREIRIELLRAKAALEREALAHHLAYAGESLKPANAIRSVWPGLGHLASPSGNGPRLAMQAYHLFRRYPMIGSGLSAVLLGGGRGTRLVKVAVLAAAGWKVFGMWRQSQPNAYQDPDDTHY